MRSEPFAADELSHDGFLGGRLVLRQPRRGYRAATDAVFLAAAVPAREGDRVLELGCGAGVALACLAARVPGLRLAGLELQPAYAALARENLTANAIEAVILEGDLERMPAPFRACAFDHVLANPPYFPPGSGPAARDPGREAAQREATPLASWIAQAMKRVRPGGWLTMIQAADRLPEMLRALPAAAGSVAVLPLAARPGRPAGRVILQARQGGRAPFRLLAPFVVHGAARHLGDAEDLSAEARAVLRGGAALGL
ncbi:tRNA1(Val) (adenine(37)-N6)-methyltransferase [Albidovulum sp.]